MKNSQRRCRLKPECLAIWLSITLFLQGSSICRSLIENVKGLKEVFNDIEFERLAGARKEVIVTISDHISIIKKLTKEMIEERKKANVIEDSYKKAIAYESKVKPYLDEIRVHIDKLELIVDNEMWPLPKYRELLFTR